MELPHLGGNNHIVRANVTTDDVARKTYDSDDSDDDDYESVYDEDDVIAISRECCVRSVLIGIVVTTAILVVVIMASNRKVKDNVTETNVTETPDVEQSVYWLTDKSGLKMVFKHQFLIHDDVLHRPMQILAADDTRKVYVIVWYGADDKKHYNSYLVVNFQEKAETFLVIAKSENEYATDMEEMKVLWCQTRRFDRDFRGNFAPVSGIKQCSRLETKLNSTVVSLAVDYVGAPLILSRFASAVVNSSCKALQRKDIFTWKGVNETLACGERVSAETEFESCPQDFCQTFPGIPLSRGQSCHKFRHCNFVMTTCSPYNYYTSDTPTNRPHCVCRRTSAEDAVRLTCPRVSDDGGECDIPRRDLLVSQQTLPCLCFYEFSVMYPYVRESENAERILNKHTEGHCDDLLWEVKEETISAPALTFSQCPC